MKLYYCDLLSPHKACAVAKYLKAPVEFVYLDVTKGEHRTPAMLALNPNAKVPTLVDGEHVVVEADAIICHLSDRMGAELWPRDRRGQRDVVSWFSWNAMHFGHAGGALYFENVIKPRFRIGPSDAAAVADAEAEFRRFAAVLDAHLATRTWILGDALSVADFSLAVALPYAKAAAIPLDEFAQVKRWHGQLGEFEAWRDPFPVMSKATAAALGL
ncbi:MAG TPA: glutathione S-transferase family protein [Rhizomicrobium sp.]|jgi:glutathione S-transferase|nr:glutathione S-transferase family protein [Rhizomicrobium sp.]